MIWNHLTRQGIAFLLLVLLGALSGCGSKEVPPSKPAPDRGGRPPATPKDGNPPEQPGPTSPSKVTPPSTNAVELSEGKVTLFEPRHIRYEVKYLFVNGQPAPGQWYALNVSIKGGAFKVGVG